MNILIHTELESTQDPLFAPRFLLWHISLSSSCLSISAASPDDMFKCVAKDYSTYCLAKDKFEYAFCSPQKIPIHNGE